jgi:hypothetical protein
MYSTRDISHILMILRKYRKIKFYKNTPSGSWGVQYGRTDRQIWPSQQSLLAVLRKAPEIIAVKGVTLSYNNSTMHPCQLLTFIGLPYFLVAEIKVCWSQWPRGLRRRSAAARLLRSWIWIPPAAWMFVYSYFFYFFHFHGRNAHLDTIKVLFINWCTRELL